MDPRRPRRRRTIVALAPVAVLAPRPRLAGCDPFAGPTTGPSVAVAARDPDAHAHPDPDAHAHPDPATDTDPDPQPTATPPRASPTPSGTLGSGAIGLMPGQDGDERERRPSTPIRARTGRATR